MSVKEILENMETEKIFELVREINWQDGSLDWLDYEENNEEFYDIYFRDINKSPIELARAIYYGNYNYMDDYIKFNAYGNLETVNEYELERELKDAIDDIAERVIELKDDIDFSCYSEELKEALENEEE